MLAEKAIVYGNRYRSMYPSINADLDIATKLFKNGQYKQAYDLSVSSLAKIDKNIEYK